MVNLDSTVIIQIINFLILIWALNMVLYKPIRHILAQRNEKITGLENGIDQSEQNAADKDQALKAGIRQAREDGLKEKEALENDARAEEKKIIEKPNDQARADLADIREKIVQEEAEAHL